MLKQSSLLEVTENMEIMKKEEQNFPFYLYENTFENHGISIKMQIINVYGRFSKK